MSIGTTPEFGIGSNLRRVGLEVVEAVGGRMDGDFSSGDVSVSGVEADTIGVLSVFGSASKLGSVIAVG